MEALQELVQIVNRNKLKSIDILDLQAQATTKTSQLYNLIADKKIMSDAEAAQILNPNKTNTTGYRKVKAKLKSRLLNTLFFIDAKQSSYSDRKKAYYECYRDWAAAKILMAKNAFVTSIELANKVLRNAEKFEFTELVKESSRFLRLYYGTKVGNRRLYNKFHELHEAYTRQYEIESRMEHYYFDLVIHFVNKKVPGRKIEAKVEQYYEECQPYLQQYTSYSIHLYGTLIGLMVYSNKADYQAVLKLCEQARIIFEKKRYLAETPLQIIYYQSLVCYIQTRQFTEGRIAAEKCLDLMEEGSFNWFKYRELYFILCMHTRRYQEASTLLHNTVNHKRFPYLIDNDKEIWKVYEAYVLFALWITGDRQAFKRSNFRLARFLNEIPIISKDKKGFNVAILIIQALLLLQKGRFDSLIERAEALYKYGMRYLQDEHTERSFIFIKLILVVVKSSFSLEESLENGKDYLTQLRRTPVAEAKQPHQIEIIPYEHLWEMLVTLLAGKEKKSRRSLA